MAGEGSEIHRGTDEARGGSTPNVVRWILGISLLAAVVLLSAIWIFGAWSQGPEDEAHLAADRPAAANSADDTGGIVHDKAQGEAGAQNPGELQDGLEVIENDPQAAATQ